MPRGDGTGPRSQGSGSSRRTGRVKRFGAGTDEDCICPSCGARAVHQLGIPCFEMKCPKCGTPMIRE